jgi:hypothetical protein
LVLQALNNRLPIGLLRRLVLRVGMSEHLRRCRGVRKANGGGDRCQGGQGLLAYLAGPLSFNLSLLDAASGEGQTG